MILSLTNNYIEIIYSAKNLEHLSCILGKQSLTKCTNLSPSRTYVSMNKL